MSRTGPAWSNPASCSMTSTASSKSTGCGFRSTCPPPPAPPSAAWPATTPAAGGRSLRYGTMRDNTLSMDAALADGTLLHFGDVPRDLAQVNSPDSGLALFRDMLDLGEREAAEIAERFPKVHRRVGGYNLDALGPRNTTNNMAHLLVGSEGTLAFTTKVELRLWPLIGNKVLGVCHFGNFYDAMDAA